MMNRLYCRDIRDLTLHGGVDAGGTLVVIPIFSGLGTKGLSERDVYAQSESLWDGAAFHGIMQMLGLKFGDAVVTRYRYPGLTAALPLPSAEVIDHILSESDNDALQARIRSQLARFAARPRWHTFRGLGLVVKESRAVAQRLLDANAATPGLLSDLFRPVLEVILALHSAVDQAEADSRYVVMAAREIAIARNLEQEYRIASNTPQPKASWAGYFQLLKQQQNHIRAELPKPDARLSSASEATLRTVNRATPWSWGLVADIGREALMSLAEQAAASSAGIWPKDVPLDHRQRSADPAGGRACHSRLFDGLSLAWSIVAERATLRRCYRDMGTELTSLVPFWSRRFSSESAVATVLGCLPSRPVGEGGALLVRRETAASSDGPRTDVVRLEPAVLLPQVAAVKPAARTKRFPSVYGRYLGLTRFEHKTGPDSTSVGLIADEREQVVWPLGRVWQAVDMAKTIAAFPAVSLCPEVLTKGYIEMAAEDWEALGHHSASPRAEMPAAGSWLAANDWFAGCMPVPNAPLTCNRMQPYLDTTTNIWPLDIVDSGAAVADVRLSVRFETIGTVAWASLRSVVKEFAAGAEGLEHLRETLAILGKKLLFVARPYFEVEGLTVDEPEWFRAEKTKTGAYRLPNGQIIDAKTYEAKTDQFIIRKRVYAKFRDLRLGDIWAIQREALASTEDCLSPNEYLRQLCIRVAPVLESLDQQLAGSLAQALIAEACPDLQPVLRPYQADGVAWTYLRMQLGLGVCLADEMGLGKTLQAIALLRILRCDGLPSLVVLPKTLQVNWGRELARFAGDLRVGVHGETPPKTEVDVWLVTYPRLRLDKAELLAKDWNLCVLDEAQAIKNSDTQIAATAGQLKTRYRLILTGTPVENHAAELWSLVDWLNPGYLGRQQDFSLYTSTARAAEERHLLLAPLKECLAPVILRRRKADPMVQLGLPEKVLQDHAYDLSGEQCALYEAVLEAVLAEDALEQAAFIRHTLFLKAILHLKQICIHPELFYGDQSEGEVLSEIKETAPKMRVNIRKLVTDRIKGHLAPWQDSQAWIQRSGKLALLGDLLSELRLESRGILLFTQYLGAAEMLRRLISSTQEGGMGFQRVPFINGSLSSLERQDTVDAFNESCRRGGNGPCPVLILSLKAGGTGLNLTGADRVIHIDRWWNPAVEDQASDRVHRIGQERTVFVQTLTGQGTVEEGIAQLFVDKRRLAEDLLGTAATATLGDLLKDRSGFLNLVDPHRRFSARLAHQQAGYS